MKTELEELLIGKSVVSCEYKDDSTGIIELNDGTKLEKSSNPYPDCCGYNDFSISVPDSFDFNDNVITKVTYSCEDWSPQGSIELGIFSNNTEIKVEGDWGSGSGWDYGQFVELNVLLPDDKNI